MKNKQQQQNTYKKCNRGNRFKEEKELSGKIRAQFTVEIIVEMGPES